MICGSDVCAAHFGMVGGRAEARPYPSARVRRDGILAVRLEANLHFIWDSYIAVFFPRLSLQTGPKLDFAHDNDLPIVPLGQNAQKRSDFSNIGRVSRY